MAILRVKDKNFKLFISEERIINTVAGIASDINRDYSDKEPLFLCILNGSFIFASDLIRRVTVPCQVTFVKFSSYTGTESTHYVKNLIGLNEDLAGRDIIIVEDIIDTGLTIAHLLKELKDKRAASVRIAAFCMKPDAFREDYHVDYLGLTISNEFVVGYGLDYDGYGRNLPSIYKIITGD
jgi:hypoxanthine phosphoribosyltransferase